MNEIYQQMADIMDLESISPTDILADLVEWDSLTVLSLIATFGPSRGVHLTAMDFRNLTTAEDVANLLVKRTSSVETSNA